ncbi:hypothetical protein Taro_041754, partial [Colocasia esculenta]|nr:hypothetical protein [Colocasia esculenta]
ILIYSPLLARGKNISQWHMYNHTFLCRPFAKTLSLPIAAKLATGLPLHFAIRFRNKMCCHRREMLFSAGFGTTSETEMETALQSRLGTLHGTVSATSQKTAISSLELRKNDLCDNASNGGRIMLFDGTSIIHRSYYKLLARLHHGHLEHADGNGDWVLTIFTSLSFLMDVLDFIPSHVAVVFDHDGIPFGQNTHISSKESRMAKGSTFRHMLYPPYKSHRIPTPDTVIQGLQYLKASIKAMSIKVPGVEADDVIGTLAVNSVAAGFKPYMRFSQMKNLIIFRMVSFGLEEFAERFGTLKPSQFVDVVALTGDQADNIPGVDGIGDAKAVKLINMFGTVENLLQSVDQVENDRIKKALIANADQVLLCKNLVTSSWPIS